MTNKVKLADRITNILPRDHLIIATKTYYSFKDEGAF
ncbi:JAB domain-containing protein [Flavobacterium johnsoniae]